MARLLGSLEPPHLDVAAGACYAHHLEGRSVKMNAKNAITRINERGMLLVFPVNNRPQPASLWSEFFPRSPLRWEWDDTGDSRLFKLWQLKEEVSRSGSVVYAKWYRGRATFISRELFRSMLRLLRPPGRELHLSFQAEEILDLLNEDSPLSTKALKRQAGLQGKELERVYNAAMKQLWSHLFTVAWGEVDEGAFPSLAVGSTTVLFEDEWLASRKLSAKEAQKTVDKYLERGGLFRKFFDETMAKSNFAQRDVDEL